MNILIIEDDLTINTMLSEYLTNEGYVVTAKTDGKSGLSTALTSAFDLCIIDVMLPEINGFDVVKAIRQSSAVPIIMLTARTDEIDRILGLEVGADDYITKPFSARELIARIRAIQRRVELDQIKLSPSATTLTAASVTLTPGKQTAHQNGVLVDLTSTEYALLTFLIEHKGTIVDKQSLSQSVLGRRLSAFDRSIDMHISNLRKKLSNSPEIKTIRGTGYLLADD